MPQPLSCQQLIWRRSIFIMLMLLSLFAGITFRLIMPGLHDDSEDVCYINLTHAIPHAVTITPFSSQSWCLRSMNRYFLDHSKNIADEYRVSMKNTCDIIYNNTDFRLVPRIVGHLQIWLKELKHHRRSNSNPTLPYVCQVSWRGFMTAFSDWPNSLNDFSAIPPSPIFHHLATAEPTGPDLRHLGIC